MGGSRFAFRPRCRSRASAESIAQFVAFGSVQFDLVTQFGGAGRPLLQLLLLPLGQWFGRLGIELGHNRGAKAGTRGADPLLRSPALGALRSIGTLDPPTALASLNSRRHFLSLINIPGRPAPWRCMAEPHRFEVPLAARGNGLLRRTNLL
jgi:hypothetical protein